MPGCIIVSNGIISDYSYYKSKILKDDYIICADGGIKHVIELGCVPDLWLGDFDSCKFSNIIELNPELKSVETISLNPEKDVTDTHYACMEALKRGYRDITLWGACGGRVDHMISNINLLEFLKNNNATAKIEDEKNTIRLCSHRMDIIKKRKYLSILPLNSSVVIAETKGLKYPLKEFKLAREISMGVSNEITGSDASILIKSGMVLVIESDD